MNGGTARETERTKSLLGMDEVGCGRSRSDDDARLIKAFFMLHFPDGYCCPRCGGGTYSRIRTRPFVCQCTHCSQQTSLAVGTFMEQSKVDSSRWLHAIRLFVIHGWSISIAKFSREVGVTAKAGTRMMKKLDEADPGQLRSLVA